MSTFVPNFSLYAGAVLVDGEYFYDALDVPLAPLEGGRTAHVSAAAPPLPYVPAATQGTLALVPSLCRDTTHLYPIYLSADRIFAGASNPRLHLAVDHSRRCVFASLSATSVAMLRSCGSQAAAVPTSPSVSQSGSAVRPPTPTPAPPAKLSRSHRRT